MIDFLIKSTLSLAVLLAVYHLVLEKEKMHQFNRFYLLFSLFFSFTVPFITIELVTEVAQNTVSQNTIPTLENSTSVVEKSTDYSIPLLWFFYGLTTLLLLIRFIRNISKLNTKAKSRPFLKYKQANLVLLSENTLPFTFFNTIFVNEVDYHNQKIETELFTHELIHVTQKHTIDVVLIETIKVFLWFNPIFIFYKKAIQLNHEFLADTKVVESYNNVSFYQNLLLAKANANPTHYLASNLNYSLTKKRLIMMTRNTSRSTALLKKGLLIPLFTAIIFSLCTKVVAQTKTATQEGTAKNPATLLQNYYSKTTFKIKDESGKVVASKKYSELTTKEKNIVPPLILEKDKPFTNENFDKALEKGGPETFVVDPFDKKNIKVKSEDENAVYNVNGLGEKPEFPAGMEAFYQFVAKNYTISEESAKQKLKGKVYVTFIVEKDGSLSELKTIRDMGYGTGDEAIRVLKLCPNWIPGKINDEPVRVLYSLPITIQAAN